MPFTDAICEEILNFYLGDSNYDTTKIASSTNVFPLTKFTTLYLALCTNDPEADNGAVNELPISTDSGYARVLLNNKDNSEWPDYLAAAGVNPATAEDTKGDADLIEKVGDSYLRGLYNKKEIHFNKAKTAWPEIKGFAIYTAEKGGMLLYYAKLDSPLTDGVPANGVALIDPGTLKIGFAKTDVTET